MWSLITLKGIEFFGYLIRTIKNIGKSKHKKGDFMENVRNHRFHNIVKFTFYQLLHDADQYDCSIWYTIWFVTTRHLSAHKYWSTTWFCACMKTILFLLKKNHILNLIQKYLSYLLFQVFSEMFQCHNGNIGFSCAGWQVNNCVTLDACF